MKDQETKKYGITGSRSFIKKLKRLISQMLKKEKPLSQGVNLSNEEFNHLLKMTHYFD